MLTVLIVQSLLSQSAWIQMIHLKLYNLHVRPMLTTDFPPAGSAIMLAGCVIGALFNFLIARYLARDWAKRKTEQSGQCTLMKPRLSKTEDLRSIPWNTILYHAPDAASHIPAHLETQCCSQSSCPLRETRGLHSNTLRNCQTCTS